MRAPLLTPLPSHRSSHCPARPTRPARRPGTRVLPVGRCRAWLSHDPAARLDARSFAREVGGACGACRVCGACVPRREGSTKRAEAKPARSLRRCWSWRFFCLRHRRESIAMHHASRSPSPPRRAPHPRHAAPHPHTRARAWPPPPPPPPSLSSSSSSSIARSLARSLARSIDRSHGPHRPRTRAHPRSHSPLLRYARSGLWVEGLGMSGVCQSHVDQVLAITAIKPRTSPPSKQIFKL